MRDNSKNFANWFPFIFFPIIILVALFLWTISKNNATDSTQPDSKNSVSVVETPTQQPTLAQPTAAPTPENTATNTPEAAPGGLPAISQDMRGLITNGNRNDYKIALTFDVCQAEGELSGYDANIVRILADTQTPATFFLGGEWIRDHADNARELANNPLFQLGNHSWSHADFSNIAPDQMGSEIRLAQEMLYKLTGRQNNLFRLPYGTYTDEALRVIDDAGLYVIQWDVVSGDPDPNVRAAAMSDWVLQQAQPGSIIIMHANGRGWHTAEALPGIIQALRDRGYTPVTVSELLNTPRP